MRRRGSFQKWAGIKRWFGLKGLHVLVHVPSLVDRFDQRTKQALVRIELILFLSLQHLVVSF